jgi:hypothetical protein
MGIKDCHLKIFTILKIGSMKTNNYFTSYKCHIISFIFSLPLSFWCLFNARIFGCYMNVCYCKHKLHDIMLLQFLKNEKIMWTFFFHGHKWAWKKKLKGQRALKYARKVVPKVLEMKICKFYKNKYVKLLRENIFS